MVRHDQQVRRIGEGLVIGEPCRIGVAMRADDRQVGHRGIEGARDVAGARLGREQAVGMKVEGLHAVSSESVTGA
jgi:hypothetical protein